MRFSLPRLKRRKSRCFLVLDIGSETVKTLVLKNADSKMVILGSSLNYLDKYSVFNGREFEADVIRKNISEAIENNQAVTNEKPDSILVGLSADAFKGRIIWQTFKRTDPGKIAVSKSVPIKKNIAALKGQGARKHKIINEKEERHIYQRVLREAEKKVSEEFARASGILPEDIYFTSLKIIEIKIDGYQVSDLRGYEGEKLEFKTLATFLPEYYFKNLKKALQEIYSKNKILPEWKIIHEGQGLMSLSQTQEKDSIFIDIGGKVSQIFIIRGKKLDGINEFEIGGRSFSEELSQTLGVFEETARDLKERYSKRLVSLESNTRIKEFFSSLQKEWFNKLKIKIKEINQQKLLPSDIFIFGGGSLLPEFKEILKKGDWGDLPFANKPETKFLYPEEFKSIESLAQNLNAPQYTPSLLIYYGANF